MFVEKCPRCFEGEHVAATEEEAKDDAARCYAKYLRENCRPYTAPELPSIKPVNSNMEGYVRV